MLGSTASKEGQACQASWLLGADGLPLTNADGSLQRPLANDWDVNILVQWQSLLGAIDGRSRALQEHMVGRLLMQPLPFLRGLLAGGVDTDGTRQKTVRSFGCGKLILMLAWALGLRAQLFLFLVPNTACAETSHHLLDPSAAQHPADLPGPAVRPRVAGRGVGGGWLGPLSLACV